MFSFLLAIVLAGLALPLVVIDTYVIVATAYYVIRCLDQGFRENPKTAVGNLIHGPILATHRLLCARRGRYVKEWVAWVPVVAVLTVLHVLAIGLFAALG